jgi:hypothetical protein
MLGHPLYPVFLTLQKKDRQSVIDALSTQQRRRYRFKARTLAYLEKRQLQESVSEKVEPWPSAELLDEAGLEHVIQEPWGPVSEPQQTIIKDGARVAAYQAQHEAPVVKRWVGDDAGQSKEITDAVALCGVHDGRHDQKLMPVCEPHQKLRAEVLEQYWHDDRELLKDTESPTHAEAARLEPRVDAMCGTKTGDEAWDARIETTHAKDAGLLAVLRHPEVPWHTNAAERGARARVRKRAVS